MKLTIDQSKYNFYKTLYKLGMPVLIGGIIAGELWLGYTLGLVLIVLGFAMFATGLVLLNNLFICPHCGQKMITNAKKDFKKGKNPDTCPNCKKKVTIEIK